MNKATIFLFPVVLGMMGCAGKPTIVTEEVPMLPIEVPGTQLPSSVRETVRNDEVVRNLTIFPYKDPNNPSIRHDGHDIQVLEKDATWNLKPNAPLTKSGPVVNQKDPADSPNPYVAELEQELVRQRDYTTALLEQSKQNEEALKLLKDQNENIKTFAMENANLKKMVEGSEEKIREMETAQQQERAERNKGFWQRTIEKFKSK